jgi:hypothetical protein
MVEAWLGSAGRPLATLDITVGKTAFSRGGRRSLLRQPHMSAPVSRSFLYQTVAKILVPVRGQWAGLVFDGLAALWFYLLTTGFPSSHNRSRSAASASRLSSSSVRHL